MYKKTNSKNPQEQLQVNFVQQTHLLQVEKKWGKIQKKTLKTKFIQKRKTKRVTKTGEKQTKNNIIRTQNPCEG